MEQKVTFRCNSCGKLAGLFFLLVIGVIFAYTEDAYAASINLDAEVRGTTILFSWNDVSQTDTVTYYALILESPSVEIQTNGDDTEFLVNHMYGASAGDSLIWKIEARDSGRSAEGGGSYVVASDTLTVSISGNGAPRVDAGSDITPLSNEKVTLVGIISDPNNDHVLHEWMQVSGPTVVYTQTTGYSLEFTAPTVTNGEQVLVFKLSATDGVLTVEDTVSVTVQNSRPTADAGPDQTVTNGTSVTLDAEGSSDRDGSLSYLWEQVSGTNVDFSNTSRKIAFDAPASASDLTFKLTVNDSQYDATDSASVRVVENSPPNAMVLHVNYVEAGETVILNGSGTSDPDNDQLTYEWTQIEGETVIISNDRSTTASFIVPDVMHDIDRNAIFQLSVSDGTFADTYTISVYFHENSPPIAYAFGHVAKEYENVYVVGSVPEGADYVAPRGVVFMLNGSGSIDRDALTYEWRQISGVDVQLNNANEHTATFNTEINTHGTLLKFELRVNDTAGNSDTATLTIAVDGILYPVADAGLDIEARPGTVVLLDGSASVNPAGGDLVYSWTQTGGETVELFDRRKSIATFTAPATTNVIKTLSFSLTVETNSASDKDEVNIRVVLQSIKPVADAGNNMRVDGGANVTLDGTGSVGNGLSYDWQQSTGTRVTLSGPNTAMPSFIAPDISSQIVLGFMLTVTDSTGVSDSDRIRITVGHDAPPTADAGYNINAFVNSYVILSGSGSDPESRALSYSWMQTGGRDVTLSNPDSSVASFTTPSMPSELSFIFTVMDPGGNSATDRMMVSVLDNESQVPSVVADAGHDQIAYVDDMMHLDGESSVGTGLSYSWTKTSGPSINLSDSSIASPMFTAPSTPSVLIFNLAISSGNNIDNDSVKITIIENSNDPPSADAGTDMTVRPRETVNLSGSGSDPDNDRISYSWMQTGGHDVILTNSDKASASFTAPNLIGTLTFMLTVVDSAGQAGSDSIDITVESTLPVADAGSNQSVEPGVTVNLDGRSSHDPDSNQLGYSWTQTNGTVVSLSGMLGSTPSFRSPNVMYDVLIFELTVTDGDGNVGTDSVSVTVVSLEPTADASVDQTVKSNVHVRLDGSGSTEGAGHTDYLWTQTSGGIVEIEDIDSSIAAFVSPDSDAVLTFKLTVTNGAYSDSDTITVTVDGNDAPNVGAGADKYVKSGEKVDLRGFADDPDNIELSYQWSHESGPSVTIYNDHTSTPYFIAPNVSGTQKIVIKLVVTDGEGGTNSDTITVSVRENHSPVVVFEPVHMFVVAGDRVVLDASRSYDPDNDDLSYEWVFHFGPEVSILGSGERVSFIAPAVSGNPYEKNTVIMILKVTDGAFTDGVAFQIDITNNNKPVVNVSQSSIRVASNSTFILSGTLNDSDGDSYAWWTQTGISSAISSDSSNNGDTFTHTYRAPVVESGTVVLTFKFIASDSNWVVDKIVTVTVYAP